MGLLDGADGIVEFTLTEDEFVAAAFIPSRAQQSNRRRGRLIAAGGWAAIPLGLTMIELAQHGWRFWARADVLREWLLLVFVVPLVTLVAAACIRLSSPRRLRRKFRDPRYAAFAGRRRFAVTPDGLAVTGVTETLLSWASFVGMRRFPAGLTVDLSPSSQDFIPRRAFADDAALDRFERLVRQHGERAQNANTPAPSVVARAVDADGSAISYALTLEDHVAYMYFTRRRSFAARHSRFLTMTVVILLLPAALIAFNHGTLGWPDAEESLALAALLFFVVGIEVAFWYGDPWLDRRLYRMIVRARGLEKLIGPARAEIAADGVRVTAQDGGGTLPWRSIHAVESGPDALYLFITPEQAHIIPRRAFGSDGFCGLRRLGSRASA